MTYRERQRLADIQAAIDAIRSHLQRGDLSDGLAGSSSCAATQPGTQAPDYLVPSGRVPAHVFGIAGQDDADCTAVLAAGTSVIGTGSVALGTHHGPFGRKSSIP